MLVDRNLLAEFRAHSVRVIAKSVAGGALGGENQELIVGHLESELLVDVPIMVRRLISGAAGAVEPRAGVDARGRDIAVVLPRDRVAGATFLRAMRWAGDGRGGG